MVIIKAHLVSGTLTILGRMPMETNTRQKLCMSMWEGINLVFMLFRISHWSGMEHGQQWIKQT
jgi:hypothetical protein